MKNMKTILSILLAIFIGQIVQAGTVTGTVLYQGDSTRPINSVIVTLKDANNNLFATTTTGPDGVYLFTDVPTGTYNIRGIKDAPGGGVTMMDATLVLFHILGFYPFDDIQSLAADVTGNKVINTADYLLIVKHIVRNTPFPVGEWVFLNETIQVNDLKGSGPGGLTGSSAGDVGGVFVPGTRGLEAYPVASAGVLNAAGEESVKVSLKSNEVLELTSAGLLINYPSNLINIESVEFPGNDFEYFIEGNQIRIAWIDPSGNPLSLSAGQELVTLNCRTTSNFTAGMKAQFTLDGNTSLVNTALNEIKDAKLQIPSIEYALPSLRLSNYPNPFAVTTTLSFYLPESGSVSFSIFDQNGRMVKEIKAGEMTEGNNTYILEGSGLTPGSYYCKLNLNGKKAETIRILKTY